MQDLNNADVRYPDRYNFAILELMQFSSGFSASPTIQPKKQLDLSLISLVLSNIFTAYLAVTQGWSFQGILLVYWIQSVIIGIFQFIKILDLKEFSTEGFKINGNSVQPTQSTKLQTALFFAFHYGFFHFIYLIFISTGMFSQKGENPLPIIGILIAGATYLINHTVSFFLNRAEDQKQYKNIGAMMFFPYARIIPMHLTIIFGATLNIATIFFFILKTLADILMHQTEHGTIAPSTTVEGNTIKIKVGENPMPAQSITSIIKITGVVFVIIFLGIFSFIALQFFLLFSAFSNASVNVGNNVQLAQTLPQTQQIEESKQASQRTLLSGIIEETVQYTDDSEDISEIPLVIPTMTPEPTVATSTAPTTDIVDTNQQLCFNDTVQISCGSSHKGQDAEYRGATPRYQDHNNGTISDLNTGLMWSKAVGEKQSYYDALRSADSFSLAGYNDWRIPTIKELYTLMDFSGIDIPAESTNTSGLSPFINTDYFEFKYGDTSKGERIIDSQWVTTTKYVSTVMNKEECFFGVNFADGRIKCYPTNGRNNGYYIRYVRGNEGYGTNSFAEDTFQTILDKSTGLLWQKVDSTYPMSWKNALEYCESLQLAGRSDWRLPNIKELQYIVDYSRSPDTTNSPAINPMFSSSPIINMLGQTDFPYYWSSTTHKTTQAPGAYAAYISFGRGMGYMNGQYLDVHGAGSQRSDPKAGNIADFPQTKGPQGDVRRLYNFVRCVAN